MTLVAKVFGALLGVTALSAGVAVPLTQQFQGVSLLPAQTIKNFPEKEKNKDKCQILEKDDSAEKYLLICDFEGNNSPRFFYFQGGEGKLSHVNSFLEPERKGDGKIKFKFSLSDNGVDNSGTGEMTTPYQKWIDFLLESGVHNCHFTNKSKTDSGWSIQCTQGIDKKQDINLAPIIWN